MFLLFGNSLALSFKAGKFRKEEQTQKQCQLILLVQLELLDLTLKVDDAGKHWHCDQRTNSQDKVAHDIVH